MLMRKYAITFLLLCLHGLARGQTEGYSCYYWFDDDYASLRTVTSPTDSWQMMADASGLSESLHTIHLMARRRRAAEPAQDAVVYAYHGAVGAVGGLLLVRLSAGQAADFAHAARLVRRGRLCPCRWFPFFPLYGCKE